MLNFLTLFTSASTLLCCALPALMVAIGAGSVFASLISTFPQLIWVSQNKVTVFIIAGVMLLLGGYMQYRARNAPCPIDIKKREACIKGRKISKRIYIFSLILYIIGGFMAFIAPYLYE